MIIKKVAGGAAEWEALRQMSPTFLSPFQQVSFFFFVVLNVFRFFYLNKSFFRIFWIYFNRYLSINIIDIIWYFGPTIIGITKTTICWSLSKSGDWSAHYVDWVFVGPAQLSTPPPSSGLAPSATNKGRSTYLGFARENVNFGIFLGGKNKSFPPWGFIFFIQPEMVDSE